MTPANLRVICDNLNPGRQFRIARLLGWHHGTIGRKLNGKSPITESDALAIQKAIEKEGALRFGSLNQNTANFLGGHDGANSFLLGVYEMGDTGLEPVTSCVSSTRRCITTSIARDPCVDSIRSLHLWLH
jgi:hypothetical protein